MTFKTKFRIGEEFLIDGKSSSIEEVTIRVGRNFKEVKYGFQIGSERLLKTLEESQIRRALGSPT